MHCYISIYANAPFQHLYKFVHIGFIYNSLTTNSRNGKQIMHIDKIQYCSASKNKMLMHSVTCMNLKYFTVTKKVLKILISSFIKRLKASKIYL